MKLFLILVVAILGNGASSAKVERSGNCGLLAGNFEGYYVEDAGSGI
jgi:hypothetical protein